MPPTKLSKQLIEYIHDPHEDYYNSDKWNQEMEDNEYHEIQAHK